MAGYVRSDTGGRDRGTRRGVPSPIEGLGARGFVHPPWLRFAEGDVSLAPSSVANTPTASRFCTSGFGGGPSSNDHLRRVPGPSVDSFVSTTREKRHDHGYTSRRDTGLGTSGYGGYGYTRLDTATSRGHFQPLPHPDAPMHTSLLQRSLRINKAITTFARFLDRRPAGLAAAEDGSLDIHQIWQHSEHQLNLGRQELLHEARLRGLWQMAFPSSQRCSRTHLGLSGCLAPHATPSTTPGQT